MGKRCRGLCLGAWRTRRRPQQTGKEAENKGRCAIWERSVHTTFHKKAEKGRLKPFRQVQRQPHPKDRSFHPDLKNARCNPTSGSPICVPEKGWSGIRGSNRSPWRAQIRTEVFFGCGKAAGRAAALLLHK